MPFEPLNLGRNGGITLSIDKAYRLRLSSQAAKKLSITPFTYLVVSVDVDNKRVGIVRQELHQVPNASTVRPDKRLYLGTKVGKVVCDKLALSPSDLPVKFDYIGRVDQGAIYWESFDLSK